MNKIIIKSRSNGINILQLKLENMQLKRENLYYKAELKLSCNELNKSEKWQIFERRKKFKYHQTLQAIKAIADSCISCGDCGCAISQMSHILDLITKAEEE